LKRLSGEEKSGATDGRTKISCTRRWAEELQCCRELIRGLPYRLAGRSARGQYLTKVSGEQEGERRIRQLQTNA